VLTATWCGRCACYGACNSNSGGGGRAKRNAELSDAFGELRARAQQRDGGGYDRRRRAGFVDAVGSASVHVHGEGEGAVGALWRDGRTDEAECAMGRQFGTSREGNDAATTRCSDG